MKIKFLGNSHLGTIAPALTNSKAGHEVEHFISRTYGSVYATVSGAKSTAELPYLKLIETARYGHAIDLLTSDTVVSVGLNFSLVQMVKLWENFNPVDAICDFKVPHLSETLWDAYVDAAFDRTHMLRVVETLIALGAPSVVAIPQPAPAEWVLERSGQPFDLYSALARSGDWDKVLEDFQRQIRRLKDAGVEVFSQPQDTLNEQGFTKSEFAMGDPSDASEGSFYARGDFYHMNRTFAAAFAPAFYEWIDRRAGR